MPLTFEKNKVKDLPRIFGKATTFSLSLRIHTDKFVSVYKIILADS